MSEDPAISGRPTDPTDCVLGRGGTNDRVLRQRRKALFDDRVTRNGSRRADLRGLLEADARNDRLAVMNSLHAHLEKSLGT